LLAKRCPNWSEEDATNATAHRIRCRAGFIAGWRSQSDIRRFGADHAWQWLRLALAPLLTVRKLPSYGRGKYLREAEVERQLGTKPAVWNFGCSLNRLADSAGDGIKLIVSQDRHVAIAVRRFVLSGVHQFDDTAVAISLVKHGLLPCAA
jgi:hypothetical protein